MLIAIRTLWRIVMYTLATLMIVSTQSVLLKFKIGDLFTLPRWYHRTCLWAFGVKVRVHGQPQHTGPVLYTVNHCSYLDILIAGSVIKGSFIAKHEIASWPIFGYLGTLQQTIYIKRDKAEAAAQKELLQKIVREGRNLIMFAEGTTSDGNRVLPFKSSLFSIADDMKYVQPVTIKFSALDGLPPGRTWQPVYGWYGDMELVPHIKQLIVRGKLQIDVYCHEPISTAGISRKALAKKAEDAVRSGFLQQQLAFVS